MKSKTKFQVGDYITCYTGKYNITNKNAVCRIIRKHSDYEAKVEVVFTTEDRKQDYIGELYDINLGNFKLAEKYYSPVYCALIGEKHDNRRD